MQLNHTPPYIHNDRPGSFRSHQNSSQRNEAPRHPMSHGRPVGITSEDITRQLGENSSDLGQYKNFKERKKDNYNSTLKSINDQGISNRSSHNAVDTIYSNGESDYFLHTGELLEAKRQVVICKASRKYLQKVGKKFTTGESKHAEILKKIKNLIGNIILWPFLIHLIKMQQLSK